MFKLFFKYKLKLITILVNIFLLSNYLNCVVKEPVGLINIGDTCYMNSLLQMLFSMDDLNNLINLNKDKYNKQSIILSYIEVYNEYQKAKNPYKPISFCTRIQEERDIRGQAIFPKGQGDSVELLIFFLGKLITDIINGQDLVKKINDMLKIEPVGYNVNYNNNVLIESPFIAGPIIFIDYNDPNKLLCSNLLDCLKYYFSNQFLGGKINHVPEYLFILYSLERNTEKIKKVPEFSSNLNLGKLDNKRDLNYKLLATLNHLGEGLSSGHYISLINRGNNFYKCDDDSVEKLNVNIDEFLKNLANNKDNIQNKYGTPKVILYKSTNPESQRNITIDINDIFVEINNINDIIRRINLPQDTINSYLNYIHTSFDDIKQMLNNKNITLADLSRNIKEFLKEQQKEYENTSLLNRISVLTNKPKFIDFQFTFQVLEVYKNNLKK